MINWKQEQYARFIKTYQMCFYWNNPDRISRLKYMSEFLTQYLKTPLYYQKDARNYYMLHLRFQKLPRKLNHKFNRVLRRTVGVI